MTKVTEAIYTNGLLKPIEALELAEQQRVRLTIEPLDGIADRVSTDADYQTAYQRLLEGIQRMNFHLRGPLPSREELHERR